ncbi:transcription factor [Fusarium heterosporum]|uniref:Transcription factor n=1 Tax=Fusarium heterosporum TaxID=42747 RepID=A0A8H5TFJ8_FUSHE|nr:transcription factor [Fusarium heterosporum]
MAPSDNEIEQALLDATYQVFKAFPEETTVNKVRKQTEENLGLEEGFLSTGDWKKQSKALVKERVEKLAEGWVPDNEKEDGSDDESEKGVSVKRSSPDVESPQPKSKRQKRSPKPKPKAKPKPKKAAKKVESDAESDLSELGELSEPSQTSEVSEMSEEEPQKKRKRAPSKKAAPKKATQKRKPKTIESDEEDEDVAINSDTEKPAGKDEASASEKETTPSKAQNSDDEKTAVKEDENKPAIDEEEEYSDVIDEPVKPKRQKKEKKEKGSKPAKEPKATVKKATTSDDPNTEEIKRLQGYLTKCGVRKLWHNELKQHGDDAKAKIRHLKKMLTDVGMDGRFSEAKAREIKERRELLAEVESAQEMSALWGVAGRGRASRSKSKNAKIVESDGSDVENKDGDGNDDEDDEEETYAARRKRARADLAFLGDDSDSE